MLTVVATDKELTDLAKDFSNAPYLVTGIGATNIIEALKDIPRDTEILNIGYAGSVGIEVGKTVTVGRCKLYHPNVSFVEPEYELDGDYTCLTSNDFVLSTDIKEPVVFDMELAYILALGFKNVKAIKKISDSLSLDEYMKNTNGAV